MVDFQATPLFNTLIAAALITPLVLLPAYRVVFGYRRLHDLSRVRVALRFDCRRVRQHLLASNAKARGRYETKIKGRGSVISRAQIKPQGTAEKLNHQCRLTSMVEVTWNGGLFEPTQQGNKARVHLGQTKNVQRSAIS